MNCKSKLTYILALSIVILLILGFLLFYYKKYILIIPILLGGGILFLTVWNYSKENLDPIPPEAPAILDCSAVMAIVLDTFGINDTSLALLIASEDINGVSILSPSIPMENLICKSDTNKDGIPCKVDKLPGGEAATDITKALCVTKECVSCGTDAVSCGVYCIGASIWDHNCFKKCGHACDACLNGCADGNFVCGYTITPHSLTGMDKLNIPPLITFTCHVSTPLDGYVYVKISVPITISKLELSANFIGGCLIEWQSGFLNAFISDIALKLTINLPLKCVNPNTYTYEVKSKYVSTYYPLVDLEITNPGKAEVKPIIDGFEFNSKTIEAILNTFKAKTLNVTSIINGKIQNIITKHLKALLESHDGYPMTFPLPVLPCPQTCNGGVCPWTITPPESKCCGGGTVTRTLKCPSLNCPLDIPPTTLQCTGTCDWDISPWNRTCPDPPCSNPLTRQINCPDGYICQGTAPASNANCPACCLKAGKYYMSSVIDKTKYFVRGYYDDSGVYLPNLTTDQKAATLFEWACSPDTSAGFFTSNGGPFTFVDSTCEFWIGIGIGGQHTAAKQPFYPVPVNLLKQPNNTYEIKQGDLQNSHCNFKGSASLSYQNYGSAKLVGFSFSTGPATGILYISFISSNIN